MLTQVEVKTDQDDVLDLFTMDPSTGYIITDITGLAPVKATLVSSAFGSVDGEQYHSSRRDKRNIVISLDIKQEYTNSSAGMLRSKLYDFFMPKTHVRLRFFVEGLEDTRVIYARVESFDAPLFTKDPTATISLLCFDPDFYNPNPVTILGATTPYDTQLVIDYTGNIETGYIMRMEVDRTLPSITIHHFYGSSVVQDLVFDVTDNPLIAGDVLKISTVAGDKGAVRRRGLDWKSMLYGVSPDSAWVNLVPGANNIRISSGGAPIPYTIEYTEKYGGL